MRRPWPLRVAMMAVFLGNGIAFGALSGNIVRLREAAELPDGRLGLTLLALSAGAILSMPVTGVVAGRVGPARLCLIGGLALVVALPLPAIVIAAQLGWPPLLAAMLALGMALGTMDVAMNAGASEIEQGWGRPIMSTFHAVWSTGGLIGSALAGVFAALGWSVLASLLICGVATGVLALASLRLGGVASAGQDRAVRFAWPSRGLAALCAIAAISFSLEGAMADWSGVYLRDTLGASQALASGAYSAFALAMACCRLAGDAVVHRFGPVGTMRAGGVLAAAGVLAGLGAGSPVLAAALFALVGLGVANVVPVTISAAGQRAGAAGIAAAATTGYFALMAGPPVIGFLSEAFGLGVALLLIPLGALALVGLAPATRRQARAPALAEAVPVGRI